MGRPLACSLLATVLAASNDVCPALEGEEITSSYSDASLLQAQTSRQKRLSPTKRRYMALHRVIPTKHGDAKFPVWVWWEYSDREWNKKGILQATLASWKVHAPSDLFEFHYVNTSNVRQLLPKAPEEVMRLPYFAAFSDYIRAGLLAEYGGVYLDTDVLLQMDLKDIIRPLDDGSADMVTYENTGQNCSQGRFSSNFMAGTKGNALSTAWFERASRLLSRRCPLEQTEDLNRTQGVCCYTPDGAARRCHIPWAGLGERIAHPTLVEVMQQASAKKSDFKGIHCYRESLNEGFASCGAECLWEDFDKYRRRRWQAKQLLERPAYHLFNSNAHAVPDYSTLLQGNWVISELVRRCVSETASNSKPEQ